MTTENVLTSCCPSFKDRHDLPVLSINDINEEYICVLYHLFDLEQLNTVTTH